MTSLSQFSFPPLTTFGPAALAAAAVATTALLARTGRVRNATPVLVRRRILSHMLASILIVVFRSFEVGDRVEIVGDNPVFGEVTDLDPVYTTLRADDGGTLQVPNNVFFQKALKRHAPATSARLATAPAPNLARS